MSVPPTPTPTLDDDVADALNNCTYILFSSADERQSPVNMLQEQNNRGTLVAVFGMSTWTFMRIIIGTEEDGAPFSNWEYPSVLSGLMKIFSCLLVSMIYYPIFCCITSRLTVAYLLGTVYCWSFAAYFIIFNLPQVCHNPTTDDARRYLLDVARKAPGLIFIAYICIAVTWQSIRSLCVQQNKQETFIDDEKDSYQVSRVKMLLKKRIKEENVTFDSKIIQIIEAKIYRNMPGFRYSITILAATTLSIILAYMIMMTIVEEWWLVSHIFEVLFDEYDELLLDAQNHSDDTKVLAASYVVKLFAALSSNATSAGSSEGESKAWEEFVYWFRMFSACVYAGCVIAFLLIIFAMVSTLQSYRRHLFYLQKGYLHKIPQIQSKQPKSLVVSSAKFAGFQFGYSAWGFCVQWFIITSFLIIIGTSLGVIFRYHHAGVLLTLVERFGPILFWLVVIKILQYLLVNMVFLQNGTDDSKVLAINNRNAFFNYQYFMVFINAPLGLFSCLMRIVKATAFGLWSLPRLDGSTLSRRFEQYDNGYGAYVSLLHLENSVNNPVVVVFINLLMESQKKRISRSIQASAFRLEKSLTFFDSKSLFSNRRVIRNRWHLYVTLINNPALRTSRRTRLDVPTMVNRMIQTAAGLHDYLLDDWHYQGYDNPSWHM